MFDHWSNPDESIGSTKPQIFEKSISPVIKIDIALNTESTKAYYFLEVRLKVH